VKYRTLGDSDLVVSEVAVGTWRHVTLGDQRAARMLVRTALDLGITLFDTASSYGDASPALGAALRGVPRDSYVLSTKVYFGDGETEPGLSRSAIRAAVDRALAQLGTGHVDLLSAHRFDAGTPLEETVAAFGECVSAGKIRHYGFSEWTAEQIEAAVTIADRLGLPRPVGNQPQYSILWRVPAGRVVPVCRRLGIGQVAFWSLAQGVLTGKYRPGEAPPEASRAAGRAGRSLMEHLLHGAVLERVMVLERLARRRGLTCAQLALAWVLHQPGVSSVLVGASAPKQLVENAAASGVQLGQRTLELIDKIFAGCVNDDVLATG
jgi:aryl-alcohol dehydrogenase-like predicted oxidoreductase